MDEERMNNLIADYLPAAFPANTMCPPPEIWAAVLNRDMPEQECARLEAHADQCSACASERTLARRFLDDTVETDEDAAWIVKKLEQSHPTSNVVRFPGKWTRYAQPLLGLAAAAMLMIAFAPLLTELRPGTPALPPETGSLRGAEVFISQPAGVLARFPTQLEWIRHKDAKNYRLTIYAVDGDVVWEKETTGDMASIALPDELLQRHVVYYWQVEGLNADGDPVAQSRRTRIQVSGEGQ